MDKLSQNDRIIKMLRRAGSRGIANYEFPRHRILRLSARVNDLRQDGYNIYCERQYLPNGRATNVWKYYLNEEPKKKWCQR